LKIIKTDILDCQADDFAVDFTDVFGIGNQEGPVANGVNTSGNALGKRVNKMESTCCKPDRAGTSGDFQPVPDIVADVRRRERLQDISDGDSFV